MRDGESDHSVMSDGDFVAEVRVSEDRVMEDISENSGEKWGEVA